MKIEQIYTGCLSQGAYYIESDGEAAVIDPLREVDTYIKKARKDNAKITYIFETHFHADFVSGHTDLSRKTGAPIIYGPGAKPFFMACIAMDGETFPLGRLTFKVLHTPGHTLESTCYLLSDENSKPIALFTGDTLFIGDVGRPDLAQAGSNITQEVLSDILFDSLRTKIYSLPDDIIIYPAHGAGSSCGKNMSKETWDTLGNQKKVNYALREGMKKEEFIKQVTDGLSSPPPYFSLNVILNKNDVESIDAVLERGNYGLNPDDFEYLINTDDVVVLDTRCADIFKQGFITGSINIGIDGSFAPWVGNLIPHIRQKILLVADQGREKEVVTRLARVGYDQTIGYLQGGFISWLMAGKGTDSIPSIEVKDLSENSKGYNIIDVRKENEYIAAHITGVKNIPLARLDEKMNELGKNITYYVHCASGYRSMIFCSILKGRGFSKVINVSGGFDAMLASGLFEIENQL